MVPQSSKGPTAAVSSTMGAQMLGLKHNVNLLVDYDAYWPLLFLDEQRRIAAALGDLAKGY